MTVSIDLTNPDAVTDIDLDQLRADVLNEQERRQRLDQLPAQVAEQVRRYVADGGELATIQQAIDAVAAE